MDASWTGRRHHRNLRTSLGIGNLADRYHLIWHRSKLAVDAEEVELDRLASDTRQVNFTIANELHSWPVNLPTKTSMVPAGPLILELAFLFTSMYYSQNRTEHSTRSREPTRMGLRCSPLCLWCHICLVPQFGPDNCCYFHRIFKSWRSLPRQMSHPQKTACVACISLMNVLSTIMLAASNYCIQCLCAPSRKTVDNAQTQPRRLDIGVSSMFPGLRDSNVQPITVFHIDIASRSW